MTDLSTNDRIQGALIGAYVGDALGTGAHWYYDLTAMHDTYGPWISDYVKPAPGHYHDGLEAGQSSQAGFILDLLVRSLVENAGYDQADFCLRLDRDLLAQLDGTARRGPGLYTSQSIREAWQRRVKEKRAWGSVAGFSDTTEAAERVLALAARYAFDPLTLSRCVGDNTALTQRDATVTGMTIAYASVLGSLIRGEPLDAQVSDRLMALVRQGRLAFQGPLAEPSFNPGVEAGGWAGRLPSPEAMMIPSIAARLAGDPSVPIEPAWKVGGVYGLSCAAYNLLPAAYYLAARYQGDFESAVLHAVNAGGHNQARAMLTGALCGALGGLQGIPERFVRGLQDGAGRTRWAQQLAGQATAQ